MQNRFDIAIVGAGAVGGSLACGLSELGFSVALIEKTATGADCQPVFDERHFGLSHSTMVALHGLGLWSAMSEEAIAVSRIHVSSRGHFGSVMMDARDEGLPSLGHVVPARTIGRVLHEAISERDNIEMIAPATVISASTTQEAAILELEADGLTRTIMADLLVGADGADSQIRRLFHIGQKRREYNQSALIANLDVQAPDTGLAYERFIEDGAIALLPRPGAGYAVVCAVSNSGADRLMTLNHTEFGAYIQENFGSHISRVTTVGKRSRFPLALVRSRQAVRNRLVLIGNAAHYIHPVAAQGFNLSMRDIAALLETLDKARTRGLHPGTLSVLQEYADWRKQDERTMVAFTDGLIRIFMNPLLPSALLRQQGLLALRYLPGLRSLFARAVTGRLGRQAALMRGVPAAAGNAHG